LEWLKWDKSDRWCLWHVQRRQQKYVQGNVREKPERPSSRWEHITLDLKGIGWQVREWTYWLRTGQVAGCCKYGNEPLGFTTCEDFFD